MGKTIRFALLLGICVVMTPSVAGAQRFPYPPRLPYPYRFDDLRSAVRIEVSPKDAEVYVDGYYAGIVDDFDGTFQRLRLPPGGHEIVIRRDGFRSVRENVYLTIDSFHRIRRTLEPLPAGEPNEPRPTPLSPPAGPGRPGEYPPAPGAPPVPPGARWPPVQRMPAPEPPEPSTPGATTASGALIIRVQPADAEIVIDGERWRGPEGDERLVIQVPEGMHRVEVRKDGFATFSTEVEVRQDETVPLNVSLSRD